MQAAEAEKRQEAQAKKIAELQRELAAVQERSAAGSGLVSALDGQLQSLQAAAGTQATAAQKVLELTSSALAAVAGLKASVKPAGLRTAAA